MKDEVAAIHPSSFILHPFREVSLRNDLQACDHLAKVGDALYGKDTARARQWQKARQAQLKDNQVVGVLKAIAAWKPRSQEHHQLRRTEFRDFRPKARRMQYKTFLQKGYHISAERLSHLCRKAITSAAAAWKRLANTSSPNA